MMAWFRESRWFFLTIPLAAGIWYMGATYPITPTHPPEVFATSPTVVRVNTAYFVVCDGVCQDPAPEDCQGYKVSRRGIIHGPNSEWFPLVGGPCYNTYEEAEARAE